MTLLADLQEFVHDHHPHDGMTADATEPEPNGYRLTVACACGVVFERWVGPQEADADLIRWAARNCYLRSWRSERRWPGQAANNSPLLDSAHHPPQVTIQRIGVAIVLALSIYRTREF